MLTGTPGSAAVRRLVERALELWRLTDRREEALIIASELTENVAKHTGDGGRFKIRRRNGSVRFEVMDTSTVPPLLRSVDELAPGGRGLVLVQAFATRWGVRRHRGGKVVWAELDLAYQVDEIA